MAAKAAELQMKIRENNSELVDFLQDLNRWEDKIKKEDHHLKTARRLDEKLPPIRSKNKTNSTTPSPIATGVQDKNNNGKVTDATKAKKKQKIKSYDYDAWSKFDVDAACKDVSDEERNGDGSDLDGEVDDEELEKIQEERRLQQAIMEKEKGNQLFKEGKYEASINRYTTAITLHPTNPILYANRGMALIKVERYGAAEQDCSVALELDPTYSKAIARRATARDKLKKYEEAKKDYETLLKYEPKNKQAVTEIEKLNNLIAKETQPKVSAPKTSSKTSTSSTTSATNQEKHRKRSNKPLKRIYIQEIGGSDDDSDEKEKDKKYPPLVTPNTVEKTPINNRVPPVDNSVTIETVSEPQFTIPNTSFVFETEFKKLRNNEEQLYRYLKVIPVDQYDKLMHLCIDGLISPFLHLLRNCYMRDKLPIHDELESFTQIKRFGMAVMFLGKKEKQVLQGLFQYLLSEDYPSSISQDLVSSLRNMYGVKT